MDFPGERSPYILALLLFLITLSVYLPLTRCEFVNYDDTVVITENRRLHDGLTPDNLMWAFTTTHAANWIPLTWLSHLLDVEIYGVSPWGHHLTSIIFHCLNTAILFLVFWRMTGAPWRSFLVAALFSLHPLHVEPVAWVTLRRDVLSTFFGFLCLGIYGSYAASPNRGKYALLTLAFALSLMAKPMLVTLPFALLLLDYWPLGRFDRRGSGGGEDGSRSLLNTLRPLLLEKVPLLVFSIIVSVTAYLTQKGGGGIKSSMIYPFGARMANGLLSYARYIGKTLWPGNLAVYYPHEGAAIMWWKGAAAGLMLVLISFLALRWRRSRPYLTVGWFWYLGTLVPVIGIIQTGTHSHADRYTYVPLLGLFIIAAWLLPDSMAAGRYGKAALAAGTIAVLGTLTVLTLRQSGYWRNSVTLMEQALRVTPRNAVAHNHLGIALETEGRKREAITHFREAVRIRPDHTNALYNLGRALLIENEISESIPYLSRALALTPQDVDTHTNLGIAYARLGKFDEAVVYMKEAARLEPRNYSFRRNLDRALLQSRRFDEAVVHMKNTLRFFPFDADTHGDLGDTLVRLRRFKDAMPHLKEAVRLEPGNISSRHNLNRALAEYERRKASDTPDAGGLPSPQTPGPRP